MIQNAPIKQIMSPVPLVPVVTPPQTTPPPGNPMQPLNKQPVQLPVPALPPLEQQIGKQFGKRIDWQQSVYAPSDLRNFIGEIPQLRMSIPAPYTKRRVYAAGYTSVGGGVPKVTVCTLHFYRNGQECGALPFTILLPGAASLSSDVPNISAFTSWYSLYVAGAMNVISAPLYAIKECMFYYGALVQTGNQGGGVNGFDILYPTTVCIEADEIRVSVDKCSSDGNRLVTPQFCIGCYSEDPNC